jgi:hypothetical protein
MSTKGKLFALFAFALSAATTVFLGYIAHSGLVMFGLPWLGVAADALLYAWIAGWILAIYAYLAEIIRRRDERLRKEGWKKEREKGSEDNRRQRSGYMGDRNDPDNGRRETDNKDKLFKHKKGRRK